MDPQLNPSGVYLTPNGTKLMKVCFTLPPRMNSGGVLVSPKMFLTYALPLIQLQMLIIFGFSHAFHFFLKRLRIHMFVSQALTGIFLGPTILGRFQFMKDSVFPHWSQDSLGSAAVFGYAMFLFLTGVKMDTGLILKSGKKVMTIGVFSVIAPLGLCIIILRVLPSNFRDDGMYEMLFTLIAIQSLTTFPVVSYIINELKIANAELGRVGLSAAVFSDILGLSLILIFSLTSQRHKEKTTRDAIGLFVFIGVSAFIVRPVIRRVVKRTPEGRPVNPSCIYITVALAFLSEMYFNYFHQIQYIGPFVFGLAVPAGPPLGSALVDKFETVILGVFLPLFVSTSMMRADLSLIVIEFRTIIYCVIFISLAFGIKLMACFIPLSLSKMPAIDSLALTLIMCCKGIVELGQYAFFRDVKIIGQEVFAIVAFLILLNATLIPLLVRFLYDPSRKYAGNQARNIMSLKPNTELRVLACIHRPDNVASVINLLDASYPSKECPIGVYVLHLVELIGRATPVFISHQKQKPTSSSCSQNVIHSFNQYERNNWGIVSVNNFTAISPPKLMYEDICTLALDKLTSLILIPLHRKWSIDGSIESEDNSLRTLNTRVLEKAPCSVGIFFDRGRLGRRPTKTSSSSALSVCMIFVGGEDDREALALAKQMAKEATVSLTVIHLISSEEIPDSEDGKLEAETLQDLKDDSCDRRNVRLLEQEVHDGPETALAVRSLAEEYDLFLVGRCYGVERPQTIGLSEWSDLPELGIIGDLLASRDLSTRASVLVLQQHMKEKLDLDFGTKGWISKMLNC